jgi:hypothetical protein
VTATSDRLMVELVGGPWDGHQQELMTTADLDRPRESLGAWLMVPGEWPDDVPAGSTARASYEPDPAPAPVTRWLYRGWVYT